MSEELIRNELYLAVLPLVRIPDTMYPVEDVLTLYPNRDFATNFFPDEVDFFVKLMRRRFQNMMGGHVVNYEIELEPTDDGRTIIKITQIVGGK